jgi:hypothetical protein
MKKLLPLLALIGVYFPVAAQQFSTTEPTFCHDESTTSITLNTVEDQARTQNTIIWSEDFSGGMPSGWTNLGQHASGGLYPNSVWEYRGPITNPGSAIGSRGGYAGTQTPINSPTRANGFMIFDSDYLDNGGTPGNFGQGNAPAPHIGRLTTETIDLSNHPFVKLEFYYYLRNFSSRFGVAISINNGQQFLDTFYFGTDVGVNESSALNAKAEFNISAVAGGHSQVKLRFVYDGAIMTSNLYGYYFCMIDDIKITELPAHRILPFTDGDGISFDVWNDDRAEKRHGSVSERQTRGYRFGANLYNFGAESQTNTRLEADIYRGSTFLQTLQSTPYGILPNGDSLTVDQTATNVFVPTDAGVYTAACRLVSDSISPANAEVDTLVFVVSDNEHGQHFPYASNTIGTAQLGEFGAVASQFNVVHDEVLYGAVAGISSTTTAGGTIIFSVTTNTPQSTLPPITSDTVVITAADIAAGRVVANFPDVNGQQPTLTPGDYYVIAKMNAGTTTINFFNDARVFAPPLANLMFLTAQNNWFTGYQNTRQYNIPHLRIIGCSDTSSGQCANIASLDPFTPVCVTEAPFTLTGGSPASGTYSGPGVSGGQFNPSVAGVGNHTITYTVTINSVIRTASQTIEVTSAPPLSLPTTPQTVCEDGGIVNLFAFVNPGGGNFSGTGVTANNGFDPAVTGIGIQTISYAFTDPVGCSDSGTFQIEVVPSPTPTIDATTTEFCIYTDTIMLQATPSGGLFSGPGVTGNAFVPSVAGTGMHAIIYTYTDGNNCEGTDMVIFTIDSCLSVVNYHLRDMVQVYPNPSRGEFTLRYAGDDHTGDYALIYDAQGRMIRSKQISSKTLTIDLSGQPTGVYFLRLQNQPQAGTMRLVISH